MPKNKIDKKFFGGPGGDFSKKPPGRRRQEKKPNIFPEPENIDFREAGQAGVTILVEQALRSGHPLREGLWQHLGVDIKQIMRHREEVLLSLRKIAADPERGRVTNRGGAIALLGEIGGPEEIPLLQSILSCEEESLSHRLWAAHALGKIGGGAAVEILTPYLEHPDPVFRKRLAYSLAETKAEEAVHLLRRVAESDEISFVANAAIDALRQLEEQLGMAPSHIPYREIEEIGGTLEELE